MNRKSSAIAPFILLLLASVAQAQTVQTVTVDYSVNNGPVTYRASGFLHGITSTTPPAAVVNPMNGKLFRGDDADDMLNASNYARVVGQGAVNMFILGDAWIDNYGGYNATNARIVTSSEMANWNAMVASIVNSAIANGQTFQWDIWNEPDISQFWTGTEAQYQEMWQNAVNTIRGISSSQIIVGPSTCCSPWGSWATDLMAFAKTNNVLPNIVSVHELNSPSQLESDVATIKSYLAANDPGITQVDTTEIVDSGSNYLPGMNVKYLAAAEHAGVNAAAHACWSTPDCAEGGNPYSLDGLTNNGRIANWYAYQAYANITGNLVGVTPSADVDGVAGSNSSTGQAYSVFGIDNTTTSVNFVFTNIPSYLVVGGDVHVTAYLLTNDKGAGSTGPTQSINANYAVSSGSITVTYTKLAPYQVAIIQLTGAAATSRAPAPPTVLSAIVQQ